MPLKPSPAVSRPFVCPNCRSRTSSRYAFQRQFRQFATSRRRLQAASSSQASKYLQLQDRTVVRLAGPDASVFLNDLVPAKILGTGSRNPIYTVFLSPHGRILNDVFIYPPGEENGEEWLVEVDSGSADSLVKHLRKHKLRAKFKMERLSPEAMAVYYTWPREDLPGGSWTGGQDPRHGMGTRWLSETSSSSSSSNSEILRRLEDAGGQKATMEEYTVHRMLNGVAEGQAELIATASLPQESNVDFFGGIDFHKGCYVGQELTIRTHHTGVVRKRILPCQLYTKDNSPSADQSLPEYRPDSDLPSLPPTGSNISKLNARGRGRSSGRWLGGVGNIGLALCRLEMMTDIQLTADRTNFDPNEQYKVLWEAEGGEAEGGGQQAVMLKPFVPPWLREGVQQSLHRKDKKQKARREEEDDDEEDEEEVD